MIDKSFLLQLTPVLPYRLDTTLEIVRRFAVPLVDIAGEDGTYWRALNSDSGGISLWRVTSAPDFEAQVMTQTAQVDLEAAGRDLAHIMAINHDSRPFY